MYSDTPRHDDFGPPETLEFNQLTNLSAGMAFGRFVVLPSSRALLCDGRPVCVGARAFDLLIVLLSSRGEIVSKDKITSFVWPTTTVDESNLRFQVTCLRRALGDERNRIKTIPGRGYLFIPDDTAANTPVSSAFRAERAGPSARDPRKPAIVIIDEDKGNREAMCRLLQPFNANVFSFVSIEAFQSSGTVAAW